MLATSDTAKKFLLSSILAAVGLYAVSTVREFVFAGQPDAASVTLFALRLMIELAFLVYAICFSCAALRFLRIAAAGKSTPVPAPKPDGPYPPIAIIYLCCGDQDEDAMRSLGRLRYPGRVVYIVHDDSPDQESQEKVDRQVSRLTVDGTPWRILRRENRAGGKPGALQ